LLQFIDTDFERYSGLHSFHQRSLGAGQLRERVGRSRPICLSPARFPWRRAAAESRL